MNDKAKKLLLEEIKKARESGSSGQPLGNVCFAVKRLRESDMPPEVLQSLKQKVGAVEESHDPAQIKDLLDSLKMFLDDEAAEGKTEPADLGNSDLGAEEAAGADEEKSAAEPTDAPKEEEGGEGLDVAALDDEIAADDKEKPTEEAGGEMVCEACGHKNKLPATEAVECASPMQESGINDKLDQIIKFIEFVTDDDKPSSTMKESQKMKDNPNKDIEALALSSKEREELMVLRAREAQRERYAKAKKFIESAGLDGLLQPKDLVPFKEAQWPSIQRLASPALNRSSFDSIPFRGKESEGKEDLEAIFDELAEA